VQLIKVKTQKGRRAADKIEADRPPQALSKGGPAFTERKKKTDIKTPILKAGGGQYPPD